ncbi:histone-lysine N-methyltransferase PRDM7-like isoform X2 [Gadus chalcogrammus]|uniref:histone-lysine N-methyltransferase PRDM7-like isoform X2 n=1 Tax=Gadus chalcogrammus TaxID=1042646 RepID=UPI0024C30601|nr:histone-lysine N-methyltransferase PRDM7-like isoform X2 [Gadus chalcogrammus]
MFSELTTKNRKYLRMTTTSSVMSVGLSSSKSARSTVLSSSWLIDRPVAVGEKDRAKKTLPAGFEIRDSGIPGAGLGVFYCGDGGLPIGTHFGPYEGHRTDEEGTLESGYSWEIYKSRHNDYIDAKRETLSNWMRYVNCARNEEEQNLIAFQHKGGILYRSCGLVTSGAELLVWYGDEYARHLGIGFDRLWNNKSSTKEGNPS